MEQRTDMHAEEFKSKRGKKLLGGFLLVSVSVLSACSHKEAPVKVTTEIPGGSPAVQVSPATSSAGDATAAPERKLFKTGEVVPAGYLGYKVYRSWFNDHLSNQDRNKSSVRSYLFVDLSVVNTDKKERAASPLTLIDEEGKESSVSEKAAGLEQSVMQIGKLAPGVSKRALAIFEVSNGHQYKLKIRGFTDQDAVLIELLPSSTAPAQ